MGFILALALVLRLILLNQSLWLDESIEALALMGKMGPLLTYALADYQPPLYHLIGYVTTHLFGYSEIVLRLPSLVSGVMTVYFLVLIGRQLSDNRLGYLVGILAATNPLLIYYSQEGRTYAMTAFFVTASFYYFIDLFKHRSTRSSILYTLFTILFLWTSYLSWFFLLSQGIYVLVKKRYDILTAQLISAATLLIWLPSFLTSFGIGQSTRSLSPEWGRVVGGLSWKSLPLTWVKFVIGRISFTNKFVYGLIVSLIAGLHFYVLTRVSYKKYLPIIIWLAAPILFGFLTAWVIPVYSYFRVLFVLPAYLLLVAIGLANLKKLIYPLSLISLQLLALLYFWFSPVYHRENWRQLAADLPAEAALAMPSRAQDAPLRYYGVTRPIIEPSHEALSGNSIYYLRYVEDLFDTKKLGQANFAKSGYTINSQKVYAGIQVDIYENSH